MVSLGLWDEWDNFQSLLRHIHGEREVGDTKPRLYGHNGVNYVTIKKCMVVYQEILVWYMKNGLSFNTKRDDGSTHYSQYYVAVMKKILDDLIAKLALKSQFEDKEYKGLQRDDHLYICPPPGSGVYTKCSHVRFNLIPKPKKLIKGLLEMSAVGHIHQSITRFLQYDIFVSDLEVLCNNLLDEWMPILVHYSYLPESGKIFTPLTEPLAVMLVDQLVELFTAKLEVIFLSQISVQNINEHFGKEGNKVYLSGVFKPLEGSNFKYHTFLGFKTWACFEDAKTDLQNFKESQTDPYMAGWVMFTSKCKDRVLPLHDDDSDKIQDNVNKSDQGNDKDDNLDNKGDNVGDPRQDKGNKSNQRNDKDGTLDNTGDNVSDPCQEKASKSDQGNGKDGNWDNNGDDVSDSTQGNGNKSDKANYKDGTSDNNSDLKPKVNPTTLKGAKSSLVRHLESGPKDQMRTMHTQSQNGNNNKLEQSGFASHDIKVMLKDPDPEILCPIYGIGQKVVYIGDINCIRLVDGYVSEWYEDYDANSGKAQRNNKGKLLEDDKFNSSSDSNNTSDNDKGSV
eukprot:jgi/Psemu1/28836/gm1.28836_g